MPSEITIKVGARWTWEEGDGTKCFHCGDAAWLEQKHLVIITWGDEETEMKTGIVLCASCGKETESA
jgi:hypothetical protein